MTHTHYKREGNVPEVIAASKQLYATHYFDAAFGLTAMADDPEKHVQGFYLAHLCRFRLDIMQNIPKFMHGVLYDEVSNFLNGKMSSVKNNMETAYNTGK